MANACGLEVSTGTVFARETDVADTYETIGKVVEFPQFAFTHGTASCDDDGQSGWATNYKNGKLDAGETSVTYNWDPSDTPQENLWTDFTGSDARKFRMVFSDTSNTTLTFTANVNSFDIATPAPSSDSPKLTRTVGMNISGAPVWS